MLTINYCTNKTQGEFKKPPTWAKGRKRLVGGFRLNAEASKQRLPPADSSPGPAVNVGSGQPDGGFGVTDAFRLRGAEVVVSFRGVNPCAGINAACPPCPRAGRPPRRILVDRRGVIFLYKTPR